MYKKGLLSRKANVWQLSSSGCRNLSEGGGGAMTSETYGPAWRPSFLTSFNRGRGVGAGPPGPSLDPLLLRGESLMETSYYRWKLIYSGGSTYKSFRRVPPNRTKFFCFYICFHRKVPVSEVNAPSNEGWRPPNGKSWIRP